MEHMRSKIVEWAKRLEDVVAKERGEEFKKVLGPNEFVHVCGNDSSILEFVLERGFDHYRHNKYTRIVWSERNPPETPFGFRTYEYVPPLDPETGEFKWEDDKPKQAFYDDPELDAMLANGVHIERVLFGEVLTSESAA